MSEPYNKGKGFGLAWLRQHADHKSDDCLVWPLFRDPLRGYGVVGVNGQLFKAHRLMCEIAHGPASSPDHEVAHSCGRGHEGCVNPKHLSWKTRSENQRDRLRHGTSGTGLRGKSRYKLSPTQVDEIRKQLETRTGTAIADDFGVSRSTISQIKSGKIRTRTPRQFSVAEVASIKALKGVRSAREIGEDYGVHTSVICRIWAGKTRAFEPRGDGAKQDGGGR